MIDNRDLQQYAEMFTTMLDGMEQVIKGKRPFLKKVLTAFVAGGHILLEDVPGTGKTTAAKTLAHLLSGTKYKRIQFTPDLLPFDLTGVEVWEPDTKEFSFRKGPIFTNILLADEINRTTPKVQSALLEVMEEKQVTVGNKSYRVGPLFFIVATQNPIEMEGTYPLPAAQLDRFSMKLTPGYPDFDHEIKIVAGDPSLNVLPSLKSVAPLSKIDAIQKKVNDVECSEDLVKLAVNISKSIRDREDVKLGVSTRGTIQLIRLSKAHAIVEGRAFVTDQDLKELIPDVFTHRILLYRTGDDPAKVVSEVMEKEFDKFYKK